MAATCGVGINSAMASAINALGDVHGGAGQQAMEIHEIIAARMEAGETADQAARTVIGARLQAGLLIEGFGHRFHRVDPRAPRLPALVAENRAAGVVSGRYAEIGLEVENALLACKGKRLPMNIDGATAVIYCELGFPAELARGLRPLPLGRHSRPCLGTDAAGWPHQGPGTPTVGYKYEGPAPRPVPPQ